MHPALVPDLRADHALALHQQTQHLRLSPERQVGTFQRRLQEGARRRPAHAPALVALKIADPPVAPAVEVIDRRDAVLAGGLAKYVEDLPAQARLRHPPFAATAVLAM